jgi:hypothetical protein
LTDFTQWAVLDPARLLYEIEQAHGSAIYDRWAYLDPVHAAKQTATALGVTITPDDLLSPAAFIQAVKAKLNSGGGSYTAKAVHFSGGAYLSNPSLNVADATAVSCVVWAKYPADMTDSLFFWVVDPQNNYNSYCIVEKAGNPAEHSDIVLSNSDNSKSYEMTGTNDQGTGATYPDPGSWYCFIFTAETNFSAGNKKSKIYVGDVDASDTTLSGNDASDAFSIVLHNLPFFIGNDSFSPTAAFDIADLRIMPGVSLLDDSGDIPLATRRLFIDGSGKPVDPALATASLGAPAILFSGDSTGFATNQGTGGSFTLTGSLTDASTSPSSYVAKAVLFDTDTEVLSSALTVADQSKYTISVWARFPAATFDNASPDFFTLVDQASDLLSSLWNVAGDIYVKINNDVNSFVSASPSALLSADTWVWLGASVDVGHSSGSRVAIAFVNDTNANLDPTNGGTDDGGSTTVPFHGEVARMRGSSAQAEFADLWLAPGVLLDFTDVSVRRKFISAAGKPVNLGVNGELPTGTAPQFFFSGDASTFLNNRGTGDNTFAVTAGSLTNASTSPSD